MLLERAFVVEIPLSPAYIEVPGLPVLWADPFLGLAADVPFVSPPTGSFLFRPAFTPAGPVSAAPPPPIRLLRLAIGNLVLHVLHTGMGLQKTDIIAKILAYYGIGKRSAKVYSLERHTEQT